MDASLGPPDGLSIEVGLKPFVGAMITVIPGAVTAAFMVAPYGFGGGLTPIASRSIPTRRMTIS
jgi:hypothetical protein